MKSPARSLQPDPAVAKGVARLAMLKELTWHYVIRRPALATQQAGQKKIIEGLFKIYSDALARGDFNLIPPWFKVDRTALQTDAQIARMSGDIISTLTDGQAHLQYLRLNGIAPGSIRDWI